MGVNGLTIDGIINEKVISEVFPCLILSYMSLLNQGLHYKDTQFFYTFVSKKNSCSSFNASEVGNVEVFWGELNVARGGEPACSGNCLNCDQ